MEESTIIETLETSLLTNIWVERNQFMVCLIAGFIIIYVQMSIIAFFETVGIMFLWTGIFMLGVVGVAAHVRYYFRFERNRKVELYNDKIVIYVDDNVLEEISKKDIPKIILRDKLKYQLESYKYYNNWPTFADPFYYLLVIGKNEERIVLTCLLDIKLKKKIADWYDQELEHQYQFFPFPD